MTTAELIQKIRNEIERLKEEAYNSILPDEPKYRTHYKVGKKELCEELLSFLSTLEESEKPMNLEDDLEEEIKRYGEKNMFNIPAFQQVARHFAKWGAEHSGSSEIPNCLNELADYARRQVEELLPVIKKYNDYSEEQIEELRTHLMAMFMEGAGWQKGKMMQEAVEAEILLTPYPTIWLDDCKDYDFKDGQKVRVIFIKEN